MMLRSQWSRHLAPFIRNAVMISKSSKKGEFCRIATTCNYSATPVSLRADTVPIVFIEADGTEKTVNAEIGKNLLDAAHDNDVELEGACGGELACSTCHLIFEQRIYDTLPEKEDDEDDMLDLAFEVTETSRLGCQIVVRSDFSGMKVRIPDDGF